MNPITNIKNQNKLNERELAMGIAGDLTKSWHQVYKDSAWIYIGGLPYDLTEGDVISVFSQWGEVVNINLIRDAKTGKSKGFCFLCYQDQRSTVLAVDNFNGMELLKRMLRVDHVEEYKVPKYKEDADEETKRLWEKGCAPEAIELPDMDESQIKKAKKRLKKQQQAIAGLEQDDEILMEVKKAKKIAKKEKKKAKKEKKKEKKRLKKELKARKAENPDGDWNMEGKLLDVGAKSEADLYGENAHFDFGKKVEEKGKEWNERPDFEKADWRIIEQWKIIREAEKAAKAAKGETTEAWGEDKGYLPNRIRRNN
ncbi:hypothetical protein PFISCL1PPCAC_23763 [Pristionchus fissidentatus]|uniref:RRM domain-containing protein n=1 Tax=Pristionchus fissidentatus TaxID=1538716 RepID=A0AAV5WNC0_9BILA|nr:hypothetical protein PFISCL1PPCAC_23763 [Pristionchus fissidentatus]